ncbi:MAG: putative lipid II flippase FtsW [Alphaproteobacteria bacterium]|nr:putative lipid II flippase FtsW [Alphaproteobacteria bacterium]MBU0860050.1 putative lipid II flippase FtsW [Alphaproteobacteria bacterium]
MLFARTDQSVLGRWWWTVDRGLLAAFTALVVFGVVLVAAASPPVAERIGLGPYHFIIRHMVMLVPALIIMFSVSLLSLRNIWRLASIALIGSIFAMILVLLVGSEIKGAQRWIHLPGFSLQPSEFVKPAFAVVAAWFMARQKDLPDFPGDKVAAGLYGIVVALLLLQPDLGMTVVVTTIYGALIFLAGFPFWLLVGFALGALGLLVMAYYSFSHVQSRIDRFLDPASGDNYQVQKSLEAFQNGGLFGTGPGQGTVKLGLPDAHADFIFAVAGEELGLIVTLILLGIFAFIILRGFNRVMDSPDIFPLLATAGLLVMFGFQALIHMGSSVNVLPAKGMTLPFISYGGSSLLAMSFSMGMVLALTRRQSRSSVVRSTPVARQAASVSKLSS